MIKNQIKTILFLGLLTGLLLGAGALIGGRGGLIIGLIFAGLMNFGSYWFSDKIVLAMYRAKPVNESSEIYGLVKSVVHLAEIPMPKVYIIDSQNPNAFATGRNPKHGAVAMTTGIVDLLDKNELKGVIAHEISHIKNRDTLISTIAATIAGVIGYVAMTARWGAMFGGFGGRDRDDNIIELLVLAILTPILATMIQLAISRSREYMADEKAAKTLRSGQGLASALEKLEKGIRHHPLRATSTTKTTAHLFIANPFKASTMFNLFSTHPPMEKRIEKLKEMSY